MSSNFGLYCELLQNCWWDKLNFDTTGKLLEWLWETLSSSEKENAWELAEDLYFGE